MAHSGPNDYEKDGGQFHPRGCKWIWSDAHGNVHRGGDKPAIIYSREGTRVWCRHGKFEKVVMGDGVEYSLEGSTFINGSWTWRDKDGYPHKDDDTPAVISPTGNVYWYCHGWRHRLTGPAHIDGEGHPAWFIHEALFMNQETFVEARDVYCKEHDIIIPGHSTKRATPNA